MAALHQAADHIRTHPAEADHSQLHGPVLPKRCRLNAGLRSNRRTCDNAWYPRTPLCDLLGRPISGASGASFQFAVAADQAVGGAVMLQLRLRCTLELGD